MSSLTTLQLTCMGVFHSERPLVLQSGIVVSVCLRGWLSSCFHKVLCSLPAEQSSEESIQHLVGSEAVKLKQHRHLHYRVVCVVPHSSGPLRCQQDVNTFKFRAAGQRSHEGHQIFGGEAMSRRWFLPGFLTADIGDLQSRHAGKHTTPACNAQMRALCHILVSCFY